MKKYLLCIVQRGIQVWKCFLFVCEFNIQSLKEVNQDQFTSENNLKKPWRKSDITLKSIEDIRDKYLAEYSLHRKTD